MLRSENTWILEDDLDCCALLADFKKRQEEKKSKQKQPPLAKRPKEAKKAANIFVTTRPKRNERKKSALKEADDEIESKMMANSSVKSLNGNSEINGVNLSSLDKTLNGDIEIDKILSAKRIGGKANGEMIFMVKRKNSLRNEFGRRFFSSNNTVHFWLFNFVRLIIFLCSLFFFRSLC